LTWNKKYEENVHLAELHGMDVIYIARFRSREVVSTGIGIGSCFPWYIGSLGQAIVAYLPDNRRLEMIKTTRFVKHATNTIINSREMEEKLAGVREAGYSLSYRESFDNDISIAAPVFDYLGNVIAAVGTAVLASQWSVAKARERLALPIVDLALALSAKSIQRKL
jgi:IclR family transcriptional regulator, pca regulon regulatory protein